MSRRQPPYLNGAQVRSLRESIYPREVRLRALVALALGSGLRVAELASLRVEDLDLEGPSPRVQVWKGKGSKDRTVPISSRTADEVRPYIAGRRSGPVFEPERGPPTGRPLTTRAIRKALRVLMDRAGLPSRFSVHSLRHTFAVGWIESGRSEAGLQQVMGHAHRTSTQVYTTISQRHIEDEVARSPLPWEG